MSPKTSLIYVRNLAKAFIKNLCARLQIIRKSKKKDIAIFSSRRSGSTWLMEWLSNEEGLRSIAQPFDTLLNYHPYQHLLPQAQEGHFICPNTKERDQIFSFFLKLRKRELLVNPQWRFWESNFSFISDRCLYKLFYVKDLIETLSSQFDLDVIYLIRHPVPTALSNITRGWPTSFNAYLNNHDFCLKNLSTSQYELSQEISKNGTFLEKHVLGWCLENTIPLSLIPNHAWLVIKYEDMLLDPEKVVELCFQKLKLQSKNKLRKNFHLPSSTASVESKLLIFKQDQYRILNDWKDKIIKGNYTYLNDMLNLWVNGIYDLK